MSLNRRDQLIDQWKEVLLETQNSHSNLIVVSKYQELSDIKILYEAGQRDFGENKVQDLEEKAKVLNSNCPEIRWHFIGHLQSNKINKLKKIPNLVSIQSVDSLELLQKICSTWENQTCSLFFQFNIAHEDEKSGVLTLNELTEMVTWFTDHPHPYLKLKGLMGMAPIRCADQVQGAKRAFSELISIRAHFNHLHLELSMGMSQDYPIALAMGSQWIRVGSKIFRHSPN